MNPSKSLFSSFGFFDATRVPVHAGLRVDERIHTAVHPLPASRRLLLGVLILLVIRFFKLQARTAWRPHWSHRLLFIRRVHATAEWRCVGVPPTWPGALRRGWRWHPSGRRDRSLEVVASYDPFDDVTHSDGATRSRKLPLARPPEAGCHGARRWRLYLAATPPCPLRQLVRSAWSRGRVSWRIAPRGAG